jgi:polygalacturonase
MYFRRGIVPVACLILLAHHAAGATEHVYNGTPVSQLSAASNTKRLNDVLGKLGPGDTLLIRNETYWLAGGVVGVDLVQVTIRLDGTLKFLPGRKGWPTEPCTKKTNPLQPRKNGTCVQEAVFFANCTNLILTSSGTGTLDGSGGSWWGYVKYLVQGENRPRLFSLLNATDVLVENWNFLNSAYWTFTAYDIVNLEIAHCHISNRVNNEDGHGIVNLAALNTDGFDVAGKNIHIHDCSVWNQDDCFTIQPLDQTGHRAQCTENVLVEHVNASGLGLTVGAIHPTRGHNCIRNVTFRHAYMHHTYKGIYIKSGNSFDPDASGEITNILYEDILMDAPEQVPIWIGPAQEADSKGACSLLWPTLSTNCPPPPTTIAWTNITLRDVKIRSPKESPGVVFGNPKRPMQGVVFDRVVVEPADPSTRPWGKDFYYCEGVEGIGQNSTYPLPPCFTNSPEGATMDKTNATEA